MILAHNLPYDRRLLQQSLGQIGETIPEDWLLGDTLPLLRKLVESEEGHSLAALSRKFDLPPIQHRGSDDVKALKSILSKVFGEVDDIIASSVLEHWSSCLPKKK